MPASRSQAYLQADVAAGFAVVMIDRPLRHLVADSVTVDNVEGARNATAHLISRGHRRIGLICDDLSIATAHERREGYLVALKEAGIEIDESLIRPARTEDASAAAVAELLATPEPPTAFFTARNSSTLGAFAARKDLGRQHSIALVGFDEIPMADLVEPGISTVDQHPN
jgi:LacI family transcriptional regulator